MHWLMRQWSVSHDGTRRIVSVNTPRGWAHCSCCGERLNYQYGSIAWQCRTEDLCPSCEGKKDARSILDQFARDLAAVK